jgi:hypothetical protein
MNGDTRLSVALKANAAVLEYIISLNPHDFARLRNPLLNKVMPPRITLRRVAAMAGIPEGALVARVNDLAGLPNETPAESDGNKQLPQSADKPPEWMSGVDQAAIKWVDVTPIDEELGDPMPPINIAVNASKPGEIVGIQHKWEPQPLYDIWQSRGFEFWAQKIEPELWHIFVYRPDQPRP